MMGRFQVIAAGHRPRIVQAPTALDAAVRVCNDLGVRYAETRLSIRPVRSVAEIITRKQANG